MILNIIREPPGEGASSKGGFKTQALAVKGPIAQVANALYVSTNSRRKKQDYKYGRTDSQTIQHQDFLVHFGAHLVAEWVPEASKMVPKVSPRWVPVAFGFPRLSFNQPGG